MLYRSIAVSLFIMLAATCQGADYSRELADVKSGTRVEARAEWWGYDPADSTTSLQAALDSGVKKLVVSRQAGPWLVKSTLKLPSNMEIEFEDGAEIKALPGFFKGIGDALMLAKGCTNLALLGKGIGTMNKSDYQNPQQYKPAEWRHTLALFSCEKVRVEGLTLRSSGGDGIYVHNVKDLVVDGVILDSHHRQGISVIGAENFLVRNSVIKNTKGAAPQCGMDFEPNSPNQKLVNCRVENCRFENNAHSAVNVTLGVSGDSPYPADITVEKCVASGGQYGFSSMTGGAAEPSGTLRGGKFVIRDCKIENTGAAAFCFSSHRSDGEKVMVENCSVNNPTNTLAQIWFLVRAGAIGDFGGVVFKNCRVDAPLARELLSYITLSPQCRLMDLAGNIDFNGKKTDLMEYIKGKGCQEYPVMLTAQIPLLGFSSPSALKLQKLRDTWSFKLDAENAGLAVKWQNTLPEEIDSWPTIQSGFWEKSKCSSPELQEKLKNYDGIGWYAQTIKIPENWKGRKIYLYFGAVDESGKIFLNGKLAGERLHDNPDNWLLPFAIRIDQCVDWQKPEQQLVIRVEDTAGAGGIWKPVWMAADK